MSIRDSKTALITGASSGIGAAFARKLALQGYDVILVARRKAKLTKLAAELRQQFHVSTEVLVADLSQPAGIERVERCIAEMSRLAVLVNNAGFGDPGRFAESPPEHVLAMIEVHVLASTCLSRAALPGMIARGGGAIINVSSIGTFMPSPAIEVIYCATKTYLKVFSKGLQAQLELQGADVRVQALCPGFTYTEFHDNPAYETNRIKARIPKWLWMPAEMVLDESLESLKRGHVVCVPGFKNRAIVAFARSSLAASMLKILTSRWARKARRALT